jgi:hypothetical protein
VTGGVETHLHVHVAAAVDANGAVLGVESFATTPTGHAAVVAWLASFGVVERVGVEGTRMLPVNTDAPWPTLIQASARVLGIQHMLHRPRHPTSVAWATDTVMSPAMPISRGCARVTVVVRRRSALSTRRRVADNEADVLVDAICASHNIGPVRLYPILDRHQNRVEDRRQSSRSHGDRWVLAWRLSGQTSWPRIPYLTV